MKLEKTIKLSMRYYETIHPTRKHVLDHLFCTIGNGYDWIDGELVETCDADEVYKIPIKEYRHKRILKNVESWKNMEKIFEKNPDKLTDEQRYRKAKKRIKKWNEKSKNLPVNWCPMSKNYCQMYPFPDNIKNDWLDGIIETCGYILEDNSYMGEPEGKHFTEDYINKRSAQNIKIVKIVLKKAKKLKKERSVTK